MTALMAGMPSFAAGGTSTSKTGVAIKGYDTTAYFLQEKAREGSSFYAVEWNDATWNFLSADDAAAFEADPESFAPKFGGYCTRAMSLRTIVPADPEVWRIHGKNLYLFAQPVGGRVFDKGEDEMIAKAQAFWDTL
jgi:hypothetical protein